MPWPSAPTFDGRSPGQDADPDGQVDRVLAAERRDHVDEIEGRADGAFGVILVRDGRAPQGHHRIADELLDRTAVASDDHPGPLEVAVLEVADGLRVPAG